MSSNHSSTKRSYGLLWSCRAPVPYIKTWKWENCKQWDLKKWGQVTKDIFLPLAQTLAQGSIIDLANLNLGKYTKEGKPLGSFRLLSSDFGDDSATKEHCFLCLDTKTKKHQMKWCILWMFTTAVTTAITSKNDQFMNVVFVSKTLALSKPLILLWWFVNCHMSSPPLHQSNCLDGGGGDHYTHARSI